LSLKTKTHFAFRVDIWDDTGDNIVEHVAGVDDFEVAVATYRAAVARWPAARITLRQGARIVHKSAGSRDKKMQTPPRPGAAKLRRGSDCRVMLDTMRWPRLPARTLPRDKWCFFDGSFRLNHEAFQSIARDFDR
jgi:hypothetical protein